MRLEDGGNGETVNLEAQLAVYGTLHTITPHRENLPSNLHQINITLSLHSTYIQRFRLTMSMKAVSCFF
jgi:hypothetical protein